MRSLLLAGGGLKVAFQAGVLQVWLEEAGLEFDHYDACSGGAFNLALLCDGKSGLQIADLWRQMRPLDGVSFDWRGILSGRSLVTMDAYRDTVFPSWDLDWDRIRASTVEATFTAHDRTLGQRRVFTAAEMTEDKLVATLSQAVWFPPVPIGTNLYTDAVFDTDANIDEAIERGATEIWVIWTVSRRPEWMPGVLAQFFHALEVSANGTLAADLERIRWNNENGAVLFGRQVNVKVLRAEVPIHYLALVNGDRLHRGVEQGVRAGRNWCDDHGIPFTPVDRSHYYDSEVELRFSDHLTGRLRGRQAEASLRLTVADSGEFVNARRQRLAVSGTVACSILDGIATVEHGYADILVDVVGPRQIVEDRGVIEEDDGVNPTCKRMVYVLHLRTPHTGRALTLIGIKNVSSDSVWEAVRDAMKLQCRVMDGWVGPDDGGDPIATGLLWMTARDVASQFVTARASGPSLKAELGGLARYGALFAGSLWDVAARKLITYSPF
ncbi:patatin-like phospholipase family protein [Actinomycetospora atypica]|uniref:Patatin-like phospholipase family protein n=1 Tax=Actinomycetospora atypica TaxID=1290095 RepID=A0ABV9YG25_9PSEU